MSNTVRKIMTGLALAAATSITLLMPAPTAAATTTHSAAVACPTSSDSKLINAATATARATSQPLGEVCQLTDQRLCQNNIYYYGYICQICDRGVCSQPYFRWVDHGVRCYP
jgi:hypothetical protein